MATDLLRTPETRALAEEALALLAVELGPHAEDVVVIGGLAPAVLASDAPVPHQGTTDVDLLLGLGFVYDRDDMDLSWVEDALKSAGFVVDPRDGSGWRWGIVLFGIPVKLELLCDVRGDDSRGPIPLPGCVEASALNLQGPGAAHRLRAPVLGPSERR